MRGHFGDLVLNIRLMIDNEIVCEDVNCVRAIHAGSRHYGTDTLCF
jgi:hypothetical protein